MKTLVIESDRIRLEPLSVLDAQRIFESWTSDERVAKYMRWYTHRSVEETKEWLNAEERNNMGDRSYQWGFWMKETDDLFGGGGLVYDEESGLFELGYNIMYKYWNHGYTTEAAKRICLFAKEQLGQTELIACHAVGNPASGAVLKKCGFVYEGEGRSKKFDGVTVFETKDYRLKL